jgi:hypothetical protein
MPKRRVTVPVKFQLDVDSSSDDHPVEFWMEAARHNLERALTESKLTFKFVEDESEWLVQRYSTEPPRSLAKILLRAIPFAVGITGLMAFMMFGPFYAAMYGYQKAAVVWGYIDLAILLGGFAYMMIGTLRDERRREKKMRYVLGKTETV